MLIDTDEWVDVKKKNAIVHQESAFLFFLADLCLFSRFVLCCEILHQKFIFESLGPRFHPTIAQLAERETVEA